MNRYLLAPCGLYCGVCGIYYADKHNDERLKAKLGEFYGFKPEMLKCDGCQSNTRIAFCETCRIRSCATTKGLSGCHQCTDFPCGNITNFPFKQATQFMLRSTSFRKGKTDAQWVKWEEENWKCKACGSPTFRGGRRCPKCRTELPSNIS